MNEVDRWIQGEGPPPEPIRAMLEDARAHAAGRRAPHPAPEWTPELEAELDRRVYTAIAAQEAAWARARRIKIAVGVGAVALGMAAALTLWLRAALPPDPSVVRESAPSVIKLAPPEPPATAAPRR